MCLQPKVFWLPDKLLKRRRPTTVPCMQCVECLSRYSNEWALRISQEAKLYEKNCFLTLTYSQTDGELVPRDLTLFIKKLRKALEPLKIRYFACGEYGSKGLRPHYHLIVFNWFPDDVYYWKTTQKGEVIYRSPQLEKIWTFGFSSVGEVNYHSAKYCAKYLQKLNDVDKKVKPFVRMSNRPGIGYCAITPDYAVSDNVYLDGKRYSVPRYYLKVLERDGFGIDGIRWQRMQRAKSYVPLSDIALKLKKERYVKLFGKWRVSPKRCPKGNKSP